jgi:epoxyqueuosine reductase
MDSSYVVIPALVLLVVILIMWLAMLDERTFEREFNGFRRNLAIAIGNSGLLRLVPKLRAWAREADAGLRSAAR